MTWYAWRKGSWEKGAWRAGSWGPETVASVALHGRPVRRRRSLDDLPPLFEPEIPALPEREREDRSVELMFGLEQTAALVSQELAEIEAREKRIARIREEEAITALFLLM